MTIGRLDHRSVDEATAFMRSATTVSNYQSTLVRSSSHAQLRGSDADTGIGRAEQTQGTPKPKKHKSCWERSLSNFRSIELENKGSVARDHLALERTFLAWLRTSLAFASIGIAITQLFRLNTSSNDDQQQHLRQMGKPLGATFLGVSITLALIGARRFFEGQHWIIRGKFPASRGSVIIVATGTAVLMVVCLVVVSVVGPGS